MTLIIEVGKKYIDRAGAVVGPMVHTPANHPRYADGYRWMCKESGGTYRSDGKATTHHDSSYDLCSEWPVGLPKPRPSSEPVAKPPLGIMSRKIWVEKRINEITEAMARYFAADIPVPDEWLTELRDHFNGK